jgi:hypothetical protein
MAAVGLGSSESAMTSTAPDNVLNTAIPDLNVPLDRLPELGASPLAQSIQLYSERLQAECVPLSSFNARI